MFPDPRQLRDRATAWLDRSSGLPFFRLGIAAFLVVAHLVCFSVAGREHLDLPFNSHPGETPYFSDPDAPAVWGYPRQPHYWSRLLVSRWDAQIYIGFAVRGLTSCPDVPEPGDHGDSQFLHCGLGWLPAWGLTAGIITDTTGTPPDIALLFLSVIAALILNMLWTHQLVVERIGRGQAYAALFAFNLFPSAFHIVTPYTEGATIALALGGFICLARDRWWLAGLMVGASTGLRAGAVAFGFALCLAAVIAAYQRWSARTDRWWRPLLAIPLSGWGMLVTLVCFEVFVGDWTAFLRAREIFGDERDWGRLVDPEFYLKGFTAQHMDSIMLVGSIAIFALTGREVLRRFKVEEQVFLVAASLFTVVLSIPALHEYWGLNRYLLCCPIIFLCAAAMARKHTALFVLWLLLTTMIYWNVELCSYLAQGHPSVCPCLGRVEYAMPF
jgi:hypothetical protein